jgi:hypothetical protein
MNAFAAAGAAFLVAVLWFDLMFDVQVLRSRTTILSDDVLGSISAYYRRVTTEAQPMNRLVGVVMAFTLLAIVAEIVSFSVPWWVSWTSLAAALAAVGLARLRTMPNAMRLGRASEAREVLSRLARAVYRDHLFCLGAMASVLALQLAAAA